MQIWAESGKSALPICNYSQILYQFLTFTQNLKRSRHFKTYPNLYVMQSAPWYTELLLDGVMVVVVVVVCIILKLIIWKKLKP